MLGTAASAASTAAVAAPSTAPFESNPDRIFAAIEAHREAHKQYGDALQAADREQQKFLEKHGSFRPDAISKELRKRWTEIDDEFGKQARLGSHEDIDAFCQSRFSDEAKAWFHQELDRQTRDFAATKAAEERAMAACHAEGKALWALLKAPPASLAAAAALIRYAQEVSDISGEPGWPFDLRSSESEDGPTWGTVFHENLAIALERLAGR